MRAEILFNKDAEGQLPVVLLQYLHRSVKMGEIFHWVQYTQRIPRYARIFLPQITLIDTDKTRGKNDFICVHLREIEVLQWLIKGYSIKIIAAEMNLAFDTVRSHLKNIYQKLNAKRIMQNDKKRHLFNDGCLIIYYVFSVKLFALSLTAPIRSSPDLFRTITAQDFRAVLLHEPGS